jgi:uncharacterized membrane protein
MRYKTLFLAWFGLILLTFVSLGLGEWLRQGTWLYVLVAAVIWFKAWVVARYFLETPLSHTFIRRLTWVFIAFVPVALVLTVTFGREFVEWIKL